MDEKQKYCLQRALDGKNIFITGSAGTGKSFVLLQIIKQLRDLYHHVPVVAHTGIAASLVSGSTIYSYFRISPGQLSQKVTPKVNVRWTKLQCLVMEEVSMIEPALFIFLDRQARLSRNSEEPFGGVQLILCGDFLQLPPIISIPTECKSEFIFETDVWSALQLETVVLTTIYRQQKDLPFINFLHHIRLGNITEEVDTFARSLERPRPRYRHSDTIQHTQLCCFKKKTLW